MPTTKHYPKQSVPSAKKYWLMKSEPKVYSIHDLKKSGRDLWDGVRNYQARNFMKNDMQKGDEVLFEHSSARPPGIAGLARVSKEAQADPTAWDSRSKYYDPLSSKTRPRWFCVEVQFRRAFKKLISIEELRHQKELSQMLLLKKGQRLSVMPVTKKEYLYILKMSQQNK